MANPDSGLPDFRLSKDHKGWNVNICERIYFVPDRFELTGVDRGTIEFGSRGNEEQFISIGATLRTESTLPGDGTYTVSSIVSKKRVQDVEYISYNVRLLQETVLSIDVKQFLTCGFYIESNFEEGKKFVRGFSGVKVRAPRVREEPDLKLRKP